MTYSELIYRLVEKFSDEKGITRGKPCALIFRVSKLGEKNGYDADVDAASIKLLENQFGHQDQVIGIMNAERTHP